MFGLSTTEFIKLIAPLILVEFALKIFCFYKLSKEDVKYLPKIAWFFIILFISTFGPLSFLLLGKEKS